MSYKFIQANPLQEAIEKMHRELPLTDSPLPLLNIVRYLASVKKLKLIDEKMCKILGEKLADNLQANKG
jgi:hypothetical protein